MNLLLGDCLEALLQPDLPEPAFDRSNRFVIAALEIAGYKRWILVQHVLHAERDRGVIKPPLPVVAAILSRGDWDDILFLAILHRHVFAAILGIARHRGNGRRVVKRIV